jgi:hypothetical protein
MFRGYNPHLADKNNVQWVWAPNCQSSPHYGYNDLRNWYPGDDYVDWVAVDAYDTPAYQGGYRRRVVDSAIPALNVIRSFAPTKPFMIAEIGSDSESVSGLGTDYLGKGRFLKELCEIVKSESYIKAVVYFNVDKKEQGDFHKWSAFSYELGSFIPPNCFSEWRNCLLDDSLWIYTSKMNPRLLTDDQFKGRTNFFNSTL